MFILILIGLTAAEYALPVEGNIIRRERLAYLDWLAQEGSDEIRIVNLPMGRGNSKHYNLYQALSGFPQAEGAISRTPDEAFAFIRANYILNNWYRFMPATCAGGAEEAYGTALGRARSGRFQPHRISQIATAGGEVGESFRYITPAHYDDFVAIFRLEDLPAGLRRAEGRGRLAIDRKMTDIQHALEAIAATDDRSGLAVYRLSVIYD